MSQTSITVTISLLIGGLVGAVVTAVGLMVRNYHRRAQETTLQMRGLGNWFKQALRERQLPAATEHGTFNNDPSVLVTLGYDAGQVLLIRLTNDAIAFYTSNLTHEMNQLCQEALRHHLDRPRPCWIRYEDNVMLAGFKPDWVDDPTKF